MSLKIFPWQHEDKEPFWINPDNGLEWWVDEQLTQYCIEDKYPPLPKLDAHCFYVVKPNDSDKIILSRVLIHNKTNQILEDCTSLETMACKINILRLAMKK